MWDTLGVYINTLAEGTRRNWHTFLREYMKFLGADYVAREGGKYFINASVNDAARYIHHAMERAGNNPRVHPSENKASPNYIRKQISVLGKAYKILMRRQLALCNPFDDPLFDPYRKKTAPVRPTEMIPFSDVMKLIKAPPKDHQNFLRDTALLSLLFGCALRRGEAAEMRIADLQVTPAGFYFVYVPKTKTNKPRRVPIPVWARKRIQNLILVRLAMGAKENDYVFMSPWGKRLHPASIYRIFKMWAKKAGIRTDASPHSARATAITKLFYDNVPPLEVMSFAGHADVNMTLSYNKLKMEVDNSKAHNLKF